jgi:hypothetical protein
MASVRRGAASAKGMRNDRWSDADIAVPFLFVNGEVGLDQLFMFRQRRKVPCLILFLFSLSGCSVPVSRTMGLVEFVM